MSKELIDKMRRMMQKVKEVEDKIEEKGYTYKINIIILGQKGGYCRIDIPGEHGLTFKQAMNRVGILSLANPTVKFDIVKEDA